MELALDLDHAGLQRLAELGRREADAGRVAHRLGQVVEQLVQGLAEAVDGQALEAQPRVPEHDDGFDAHARSISARVRRALRAGSGVDVDGPGRLEAAVEQRGRVGAAEHDVPAPPAGPPGDVGRGRAR